MRKDAVLSTELIMKQFTAFSVLHLFWGICCCCSVAKLYLSLCDPIGCSTPGFHVLHYLPEFVQIHWVGDAIELVHPLPLLLLFPSVFTSIRVFSNESAFADFGIRWPKYWSFSFTISLSNEYSGLISFRIDWFDLLAVQGTLKSLHKNHSSKASVL